MDHPDRVNMPTRNESGWTQEYMRREALFAHDNDPKRPHCLLRSKKHSTGFFNSRPLIADERLMREVAYDIVIKLLQTNGFGIEAVERVVGPQTGATRLAEFVAAALGARRGRPCGWASPAKEHDEHGNVIGMVFDDPDHIVVAGERVLFVEDVMTTGGSTKHVMNAVSALGGVILPFVGMMVNRSGETDINSQRLVALVTRHLPTYDVPAGEPCPLCTAGSEVIAPKDNWGKLTAQY